MTDITITFKGIDFWSRPVYKVKDMNVYVGSVDTLCNSTFRDKADLDAYFKKHLDELVIFGSTFDEDDPLGTPIKKSININII